jgi:hypothetical protein
MEQLPAASGSFCIPRHRPAVKPAPPFPLLQGMKFQQFLVTLCSQKHSSFFGRSLSLKFLMPERDSLLQFFSEIFGLILQNGKDPLCENV